MTCQQYLNRLEDEFKTHPWDPNPKSPTIRKQSDTDRVLKAFFDLRGAGTNPRKAAELAAMLPIESEVAA